MFVYVDIHWVISIKWVGRFRRWILLLSNFHNHYSFHKQNFKRNMHDWTFIACKRHISKRKTGILLTTIQSKRKTLRPLLLSKVEKVRHNILHKCLQCCRINNQSSGSIILYLFEPFLFCGEVIRFKRRCRLHEISLHCCSAGISP